MDNIEITEEVAITDCEVDDEYKPEVADPFLLHFERQIPEDVLFQIKKERPYSQKACLVLPKLNNIEYFSLKLNDKEVENFKSGSNIVNVTSQENLKFVTLPNLSFLNQSPINTDQFYFKLQLSKRIPEANKNFIPDGSREVLTQMQKEILGSISNYCDFYYPERTSDSEEGIRNAFCIHAVNHILKTRTRIIHHNAKMEDRVEVPEEFRDQGLVRPKILILVPFKASGLKIIETLISFVLKEEKGNVMNKKRLIEEFGGETLFMPKTNPKPGDYVSTFSGNVDDNFKIGIAVTKKSIKLYTPFYSSDIIVASPLGLRLIVGADNERSRDYDFLASIELVIMDQAEVFLMQNWDHLLQLMKHLHLQPLTTHGTDFARVRPWALEGLTKYYCQTLVFSSYQCPEHYGLFSKYARNFAGIVKVANPILRGDIMKVTLQIPQVFQRFDCTLNNSNEERFKYFVNKVLPNFKESLMDHTLIFVSSYFDFVRLRNHFKRERVSFVQICEYTKDNKIARARDYFFHNKAHFFLYTERAHFFKRFTLRGIGHLIFYQLPEKPNFYSEIVNFMQEEFQSRKVTQRKNATVNVIYCKYDAPRLNRIVGTERASHMISAAKNTHAFIND